MDVCGVCAEGTTGIAQDIFRDNCGVCFGGNRDRDSCGVCFGMGRDRDECGVCAAVGGGRNLDDCGVCFGNNNLADACGVCNGNGSSCAGCDGVPNSGATTDECGVCQGDGNSCKDNNPFAPALPLASTVLPRSGPLSPVFLTLYLASFTLLGLALFGATVRSRFTNKYSASPTLWLGVTPLAYVLRSSSVAGIYFAQDNDQFRRPARVVTLFFSTNVLFFVTSIVHVLQPPKRDETTGAARLVDILFITMISLLLTHLFGTSLLKYVFTSGEITPTLGYSIAVLLCVAVVVINVVLATLPYTVDDVEFDPAIVFANAASSFALSIAFFEPLFLLFMYFIVGARAVRVTHGGNGGGSAKVAALPLSAEPPHGDAELSSSLSSHETELDP